MLHESHVLLEREVGKYKFCVPGKLSSIVLKWKWPKFN